MLAEDLAGLPAKLLVRHGRRLFTAPSWFSPLPFCALFAHR
jgi:hypothetical protein